MGIPLAGSLLSEGPLEERRSLEGLLLCSGVAEVVINLHFPMMLTVDSYGIF